MAAYEQALQDSGTTMVLTPDSEFFNYFSSAGRPSAAAVAAPAGDGEVETTPLVEPEEAPASEEPGQPADGAAVTPLDGEAAAAGTGTTGATD